MKFIELTDEELELYLKDQKDADIFAQRSLEIYENYKGKYVTIVEGELFVGDTWLEIEEQVKKKYPHRSPCIRFIPQKRSGIPTVVKMRASAKGS